MPASTSASSPAPPVSTTSTPRRRSRPGAHVLVEKPVTIEPAHAWDLVETADRKERHLLISFGWNYRPMVRKAKELMDARGRR